MIKRDQDLLQIMRKYEVEIPDEIILLIIKLTYTYHFLCPKELKNAINQYPDNINMFGNSNLWNVSNITDMSYMFSHSKFNGDISNWDVSNVTDMSWMFLCSFFNGDISMWDVSNVTYMYGMVSYSEFNGDISLWVVKPSIY